MGPGQLIPSRLGPSRAGALRRSWTPLDVWPFVVAVVLCPLIAWAYITFGMLALVGLTVMALLCVGGILRIEIAYLLLGVYSFLAPALIGYGGSTPIFVAVIGIIMLRELLLDRSLSIAPFFLFYGLAYVFAAVHGQGNPALLQSVGKYLAFPLLAIATASVARDRAMRSRLVALVI